jgi:hypothetical protein
MIWRRQHTINTTSSGRPQSKTDNGSRAHASPSNFGDRTKTMSLILNQKPFFFRAVQYIVQYEMGLRRDDEDVWVRKQTFVPFMAYS